jgi:hypothetical protein
MATTGRHWYQNVNDILRFPLDTKKYQAKNVGAQVPLEGDVVLDFLIGVLLGVLLGPRETQYRPHQKACQGNSTLFV